MIFIQRERQDEASAAARERAENFGRRGLGVLQFRELGRREGEGDGLIGHTVAEVALPGDVRAVCVDRIGEFARGRVRKADGIAVERPIGGDPDGASHDACGKDRRAVAPESEREGNFDAHVNGSIGNDKIFDLARGDFLVRDEFEGDGAVFKGRGRAVFGDGQRADFGAREGIVEGVGIALLHIFAVPDIGAAEEVALKTFVRDDEAVIGDDSSLFRIGGDVALVLQHEAVKFDGRFVLRREVAQRRVTERARRLIELIVVDHVVLAVVSQGVCRRAVCIADGGRGKIVFRFRACIDGDGLGHLFVRPEVNGGIKGEPFALPFAVLFRRRIDDGAVGRGRRRRDGFLFHLVPTLVGDGEARKISGAVLIEFDEGFVRSVHLIAEHAVGDLYFLFGRSDGLAPHVLAAVVALAVVVAVDVLGTGGRGLIGLLGVVAGRKEPHAHRKHRGECKHR